jgi:peptide/nickel transport system substrate-binding protein
VSEVPIETWLGNMFSNKYGLNFMWDQVMTGDQSELAGFLLGAGNPSDFSNAQVNSLLNTEYAQTNPQKRAQEIIELNKLATGTDLVDAPLWWEPIGMAFKDGISISSYDFATFYSPWAAGISASS